MFKLLVLYAHLLVTCLVIGTLLVADTRSVKQLFSQDHEPSLHGPSRTETWVAMLGLTFLWLTGGLLLMLGVEQSQDYLDNEKLQGKLLLVSLLTVNAFVMHLKVIPLLKGNKDLPSWPVMQRMFVAVCVGLSNTVWFYAAWLGIARPWNFNKSMLDVMLVAAILWAAFSAAVYLILWMASGTGLSIQARIRTGIRKRLVIK